MLQETVSTIDYLKELEEQYRGLRYKKDDVKPWLSRTKNVLFDCDTKEDKDRCLERALTREDCEEFTVVSIVKEIGEDGKTLYSLDVSRFKRIGRENLHSFINRFEKNLKESFVLSMQLLNRQQIRLIGFSYISPQERAQLLEELQGR
jgi:hypothetical protein